MLHSIMDFTLFPIGQGFLYDSNNHFTEKLRFRFCRNYSTSHNNPTKKITPKIQFEKSSQN